MRSMAIGTVLVAVVAGCGSHNVATTSITVYASSSLIRSFGDIGKQFKADNPGTSVEFIFASSSDLASQLTEGASADVFASGDLANMARVSRAGLVAGEPVNFATNKLVIAVAAGNPKNITSFADLSRPGLRVAVCAPSGTCASEMRRIEDAAGVQLHPVEEDSTTIDIVRSLARGDIDAGVVYATAALEAGDNISWFNFPQPTDVSNIYAIAELKDSDQAGLAGKFVDLVTGDTGREILANAGFSEP